MRARQQKVMKKQRYVHDSWATMLDPGGAFGQLGRERTWLQR